MLGWWISSSCVEWFVVLSVAEEILFVVVCSFFLFACVGEGKDLLVFLFLLLILLFAKGGGFG